MIFVLPDLNSYYYEIDTNETDTSSYKLELDVVFVDLNLGNSIAGSSTFSTETREIIYCYVSNSDVFLVSFDIDTKAVSANVTLDAFPINLEMSQSV